MSRRNDLHAILRMFWRAAGRRLLLGSVLSTATVLAGMALLGLSGWFITATALAGLSAAGAAAFNVFMPSAGIRLLALGRTAGRYAERMVTHDATLAVLAALREQLFRGWATPRGAHALLRRPSRLLFRLTQDIDALESLYLRLLVPAAASLGAALLAAAALGVLDWRLGLTLLAWLLLCGWGLAAAAAWRARPYALRRARAQEVLRAQAIDLVAGQTDLAMAGRLAAQGERLLRTDARLARADDALNRIDVRAGWAYAVAGHLTVGGMLVLGGLLARRDGLGAPIVALLILIALAALEPFSAMRRGVIEASRSWLAARRLTPRLNDAAPSPLSPQRLHPALPGEALRLRSVVAAHPGRQVPALQGIDLHIRQGERVAVVGASGAGKSTLLALAAGELAARSGTVEARAATWLTQRSELFQDSLRDNLRLADPLATDTQLWSALHASGLARDVRALAAGLDTALGEGGLGLSGGQSRRLALARLLLHPSEVWLLDEPTEGLDSATAADVLDRLRQQLGARTVLVATHLRREAEWTDRLLVLSQGRITADLRRGSPEFDAVLSALRHH